MKRAVASLATLFLITLSFAPVVRAEDSGSNSGSGSSGSSGSGSSGSGSGRTETPRPSSTPKASSTPKSEREKSVSGTASPSGDDGMMHTMSERKEKEKEKVKTAVCAKVNEKIDDRLERFTGDNSGKGKSPVNGYGIIKERLVKVRAALVTAGADTTALDADVDTFKAKADVLASAYAAYRLSMAEARKASCDTDPATLKGLMADVRAKQAVAKQAEADARAAVMKVRDDLQVLKKTVLKASPSPSASASPAASASPEA